MPDLLRLGLGVEREATDPLPKPTLLLRDGSTVNHHVADGPLTPWAFLVFLLAVVGLLGLVLWRVMEATLLRLHFG